MPDVKNQTGSLRDKAADNAGNVAQEMQQMSSSLIEKGQQMARNAAEKVSETARSVGDKAEQATEHLGGRMKSAAQGIREHGPHSGFLHSATATLADGLETGGEYVEKKGLLGMA